MKIVAYRKYIDSSITRLLNLPVDGSGQFIGDELATLQGGITYVSLPATATLPDQPAEISASVATVTLTESLRAEIKAASPLVKLINVRVADKIRLQYSGDDERKFARISIGELRKTYQPSAKEVADIAAYQTAVEAARAWGRAEKAKLGL